MDKISIKELINRRRVDPRALRFCCAWCGTKANAHQPKSQTSGQFELAYDKLRHYPRPSQTVPLDVVDGPRTRAWVLNPHHL